MKVNWQKFWMRLIIFLTLEIVLNFLGLDDLADYSEFIFERNAIAYNN